MRDVPGTVDLIATWVENRGGSVGVIVCNNALAIKIHEALSVRLSERRVDCYTSRLQNEDAISLLDEGVTVMNKSSVKGQEFDTVFILELEQFIACQNNVMKRSMYMMCSRARDYLFLVHTQELTGVPLADLPGAKVLERG
jgi:superfamily I DNA/RNA helicase